MRRRLTTIFRMYWLIAAMIGLAAAVAVGILATARPAAGAFPGANGKIAFQSDLAGPRFTNDVWIMDADGSHKVNLTNVPPGGAGFVFPGAFSADGTRITYSGNVEYGTQLNIYVMDADGSNKAQLTSGWTAANEPGWSPDGTKIVFSGYQSSGNYDIYTIDADGSNPTPLTTDPGEDTAPKWSPDGSTIMFLSSRDGNGEIYAMNADGTNQRRLTNDPAYDWPGSWSPDGSKIAFNSNRDGDFEIYVMNADGTNLQQLTHNDAGDFEPSWSPDGTKMTFVTDRDGNAEIYVMNADGSGQTNLTNSPTSEDWGGAWQPLPDTTPPTITCSVSPNTLWPPNHKLVSVKATVSAVDAVSGAVGFELVSVTANQGNPATDIQGFIPGTPDTEGYLRAERLGSGGDRVYTLTYRASDPAGNSAFCAATVTVPHDKGH